MMSPNRAHRWFTEIMKIFGLTNNKKPKGSEKIPKGSENIWFTKELKTRRIRKYTEKPKPMKTKNFFGKAKTDLNFFGIQSVRPKIDPIRLSGSSSAAYVRSHEFVIYTYVYSLRVSAMEIYFLDSNLGLNWLE